MAIWKMKVYQLPSGICPFRNWYAQQDSEVQAEFDATVLVLAARLDWSKSKKFKELKRRHIGLGEIRFRLDRPLRRFRPVGIWPPVKENEFILLNACEKDGPLYIPEDAFTQALVYKQEFQDGR